jgi:hypothetical protein
MEYRYLRTGKSIKSNQKVKKKQRMWHLRSQGTYISQKGVGVVNRQHGLTYKGRDMLDGSMWRSLRACVTAVSRAR